jgi:hypothetical protein
MQGNQGSARTEAEKLVATVLAMAATSGLGQAFGGHGSKGADQGSSGGGQAGGFGPLGDLVTGMVGQAAGMAAGAATGGHRPSGSGGWSTGTAECCVCPICKVIAGLRDPSPETAERLATGAGDFAAGVASLMRAFSAATAESTATRPAPAPAPSAAASTTAEPRTGGDPWAAATAAGDTPAARATVPRPTRPARPPAPPTARPAPPVPGADPWAAATNPPTRDNEATGAPSAVGTSVDGSAVRRDAGTGDEARLDGAV